MMTDEAVARLRKWAERYSPDAGMTEIIRTVLSSLEAERRRAEEAEKTLNEWQEWGDATVAKIEPLEGEAVWGTPEVRQFIGEAVAQRDAERRRADAAEADAAALREALTKLVGAVREWSCMDPDGIDPAEAAQAALSSPSPGRPLLERMKRLTAIARAAKDFLEWFQGPNDGPDGDTGNEQMAALEHALAQVAPASLDGVEGRPAS